MFWTDAAHPASSAESNWGNRKELSLLSRRQGGGAQLFCAAMGRSQTIRPDASRRASNPGRRVEDATRG